MTDASMTDAKEIATLLLKAIALPDEQVFPGLNVPKYSTVDYYRMACTMLFRCQRCGNCCTTGDPIRLRPEDTAALAKHLKIPLQKVLKKYTRPDPNRRVPWISSTSGPASFMILPRRAARFIQRDPGPVASFPSLESTDLRTGS
jgi:hypothetical protein